MKKIGLLGLLALLPFVNSCIYASSQRTYEGATVSGLGGAIAGSLIDKKNPWRGAVIGGTIGAVIGGSITEIASRSAKESTAHNRPMEYGFEYERSSTISCKLVRVFYYQDGRLVRIEEREVCGR